MLEQPIRERAVIGNLKDPILITAFNSMQKGGATAGSALGYAIGQWQAEPVATFDADECYNFARLRPWVSRGEHGTEVNWPQNVVYRVDGPDHSYLLLLGVEPSLNWRRFVSGIVEFAVRMGVRTAVSLKSVPAAVPHTVGSPVRAICSSQDMYNEFGFEELEDQDGPADIGRLLNLQLASSGCRTIDLYALEPFYAAATPDAFACISLLRALEQGFDLAVDLASLEQAADTQRRAIDAAVSTSEQLRETVAALESRFLNAGRQSEAIGLLEAPPAGAETAGPLEYDDVLGQAEAILREFGASS